MKPNERFCSKGVPDHEKEKGVPDEPRWLSVRFWTNLTPLMQFSSAQYFEMLFMKVVAYIICLTLSLVFAPAMVAHAQASVPPMEQAKMAAMKSKSAEPSHIMAMQDACPDCPQDNQDCGEPSNTPMSMCDVACQIACMSGASLVAELTPVAGLPEQVHLSYAHVIFSALNGRTPTHRLPPPRT